MYTSERLNRTFHVVEECVLRKGGDDEAIMACSRCTRLLPKTLARSQCALRADTVGAGELVDNDDNDAYDSFNDLYARKPPSSGECVIALGFDLGRLLPNVEPPSALEKLVLADARAHSIVVKLITPARSVVSRLKGHIVVMPHAPTADNGAGGGAGGGGGGDGGGGAGAGGGGGGHVRR